MRREHFSPFLTALVAVVLVQGCVTPSHRLQLAADGTAALPIVIAANASTSTVAVAAELAEYLG
ncbi:hypothetical protein HQ590_11680, partial [bacterium]|nr:hypothetical protein [bacterium]